MLVLIVDDNRTNCEIFAAVAERLGPDIRVASFVDPAAGLAACRTEMPDLVLVDFMMPGMDGNAFLSGFRALSGAKAVPVVMITAATDRSVRRAALELGATDFLSKPVDTHEMRARMTNLLALRRAHLVLQDRSRWLGEEVRKATDKVLHLANHDGLTGLPNRAHFRAKLEMELARPREERSQAAVLCLDLDGFKDVNDTLGHAAGDALLRRLGTTLLESAGPTEMPARLGGDEFAIVQWGMPELSAAVDLAQRIVATVATFGRVMAVKIGVSVGVAAFSTDCDDVDELLNRADIALYRAKRDGRGCVRVFEPDMDLQLKTKRALQRDLRAAIEAGSLDLHYQPQADARTGTIVGFEALARWFHPERGQIPPTEFVAIAEECGLIGALGDFVLREACRQATTWPTHLRLGVNLSPLQVRPDLPDVVRRILDETRLDPRRLELEITENVLITDTVNAVSVLRRLKDFGIAIALDDFGTGYSSLSYLQRFPFDRIKIDRSFVADLLKRPEAQAIIRAIIAMTRSLRMATIAEGVETELQLAALKRESCGEVQGYLIGRPMPRSDVLPFLLGSSPGGANQPRGEAA